MKSFLRLSLCSVVCLVSVVQAEEKCDAEIKLLLLPTEVHSAISAFRAGKSTISSVYFFDTNALDLLSEVLILRLRIGGTSDLTVKLRSRANIAVSDWLKATKGYKCEDDLTGEIALRSYSIQTEFSGTLPQT